jgi:hypothetical protein
MLETLKFLAQNLQVLRLAAIIEKSIERKKMMEGAVLIYPTFIHYDIRGKRLKVRMQ